MVARNGGSRLRLIRPTRPRVRRWADIVDRLSAMFGRAARRKRPETSGDYLRQIRRRPGWRRVEARPAVGLQRLQALRELFDDCVPLPVRVAPPVEDLGQGTSAADTRFRRWNESARSHARGGGGHHLIGSVLHAACLARVCGSPGTQRRDLSSPFKTADGAGIPAATALRHGLGSKPS